jgi:hypothetical protein
LSEAGRNWFPPAPTLFLKYETQPDPETTSDGIVVLSTRTEVRLVFGTTTTEYRRISIKYVLEHAVDLNLPTSYLKIIVLGYVELVKVVDIILVNTLRVSNGNVVVNRRANVTQRKRGSAGTKRVT